jgi:DUF917 family protein
VTRHVTEGFTRGNVTLESLSPGVTDTMFVEFENENLSAVLRGVSGEERVLAVCPDLIQVRSKPIG